MYLPFYVLCKNLASENCKCRKLIKRMPLFILLKQMFCTTFSIDAIITGSRLCNMKVSSVSLLLRGYFVTVDYQRLKIMYWILE